MSLMSEGGKVGVRGGGGGGGEIKITFHAK